MCDHIQHLVDNLNDLDIGIDTQPLQNLNLLNSFEDMAITMDKNGVSQDDAIQKFVNIANEKKIFKLQKSLNLYKKKI